MQQGLRRVAWCVGVLWALSWFELYLEIYRHHHLALPRFLPLPRPPLAVPPSAQPGAWLQTVIACAFLAPFLALVIAGLRWRAPTETPRSRPPDPQFPLALLAGLFGLTLCVAGALNQLIRRPPFAVDLTLQTGNGGFLVLGAALTIGSALLFVAGRRARGA